MGDDLPLDLNPNGTISLSIGGVKYRLRRALFGELRELWEAWDEAAAAHDALAPRLTEDAELAVRREVREERFGIWAGWQRKVFATLADRQLPESDDELEAWLLTPALAADFLAHWQKRPKPSG